MESPSSSRAAALLLRLVRRMVDVRPGELGVLLLAFAYFFCLLCSYYLLRPLRDAMGLAGGAGKLPWLFTATFLAMLALVPVYGAIASRWPPRRFVPWVTRFFALNILGFGALFAAGIAEIAVSRVFFVWISVFNLFVISVFWSVLADHFDSEQGKRLFGFVAAGGTVGALAGPALAAALAVPLGVAWLAIIAALLLEAATLCYRWLARVAPARTGEDGKDSLARNGMKHDDSRLGGGMFSGIALIARDRYLTGIVLLLLLHTTAATFLYLEQGRVVERALADTASRTRLFALVDLSVSLLTIALQLLITGRFLRRFGTGAALALLPVTAVLAFGAVALWPTLAVLAAAQGIRRALDYAIARPGREVLFTVVPREAKYKAKNVIETVVYRGGDAASGWAFAALTAMGAGFGAIALGFLPLAAAWIWLSQRLGAEQERRAEGRRSAPAAEPLPEDRVASEERSKA